jgi:hypothetical protein
MWVVEDPQLWQSVNSDHHQLHKSLQGSSSVNGTQSGGFGLYVGAPVCPALMKFGTTISIAAGSVFFFCINK